MVTDTATEAPDRPDTSDGTTGPTRLHALDWLRALALFGVFVFHAVHSFELIDWHVKSDQRSFAITLLLLFLFPWGMGFFFLLAGGGKPVRVAVAQRRPLPGGAVAAERPPVPGRRRPARPGPRLRRGGAPGNWSSSPAAYVPAWFGELASSALRLDPGISRYSKRERL